MTSPWPVSGFQNNLSIYLSFHTAAPSHEYYVQFHVNVPLMPLCQNGSALLNKMVARVKNRKKKKTLKDRISR